MIDKFIEEVSDLLFDFLQDNQRFHKEITKKCLLDFKKEFKIKNVEEVNCRFQKKEFGPSENLKNRMNYYYLFEIDEFKKEYWIACEFIFSDNNLHEYKFQLLNIHNELPETTYSIEFSDEDIEISPTLEDLLIEEGYINEK